jgi:hypothetical protein
MDGELKEAASRLLAEAHAYFKLMTKRGISGGCIWLTDQDGAMVVFTRGEYRPQLLHNIEMELDAKRVHSFGAAELPNDD